MVLAAFLASFATSGADSIPQAPRPRGAMQPSDGPWNHRVLLATSQDGLAWKAEPAALAERASVPELFLGPDGKPIVLFVDASGESPRGALGALVRQTDGSWARRETNLRGADPNVVPLKDGTYRSYTKERDGAIVVWSSRDGLQWEWLGEAFRDERYPETTDADVFETRDGWVALISLGPRLLRCTSPDGLKFIAGEIMDLGGSVSDTVKVEGGWRTFFHVNANPRTGGKMLIRSAFTKDGKTWKVEPGDRVVATANGPASLGVADPAPVQLKNGTWLMAIKSFIEHGGGSPQFGRSAGSLPARSFDESPVPPHPDPLPQGEGTARGRADFIQRPDSESRSGGFPPLPRGEGRGEGERRGRDIQVPNNFNPQPPPQNFNADGPWNRDIIAYRVSASGTVEKAATFERAGVPTIARMKDGRLIVAHQHFPENDRESFDKVAVHFSSDDGKTWSAAQVIQVAGLPEGMRFPFDPTLVPMPDGRVRLYFTGNLGRTFQRSTPAIHSAISADGVNYTYEPGVRFGVEGRMVIDCAVVLHASVFHLFAPDNGVGQNPGQRRENEPAADRPREGVGYHATSQDGLTFTRVDDVRIAGRRSWLGNAQSDGKLITFYGTGEGLSTGGATGGRPRGAFWMATSTDGQTWKLVANPPIGGGDPGAVKTRDGGLLVVITGESVRRVSPRSAGGGDEFGVPASAGRGADNPQRTARAEAGPPEGGTPNFPPRAGQFGQRGPGGQMRVEKIDSKYKAAPGAKPGSFVTGQDADLMLGGFGFNNTGGALRFNHPTGLATDGKALLMTDRWNNRVLIWKAAPAKNTPPDLVLGQPDFKQNNPGTGKHQMNWPGNVAITPDGKRIAVTDTDNDRILIWNSFPMKNGAAADLVLDLVQLPDAGGPLTPSLSPSGGEGVRRADDAAQRERIFPPPPRNEDQRAGPDAGAPNANFRPRPGGGMRFGWPWGVWTDGKKLAVVATHGSAVLIWNSLPTRDNQPPDLVLRPSDAGTPRNVTSDGSTFFAVSDHNYGDNSRPATMVWSSFPTSATQPPDWTWREWVKGSFTSEGKLIVGGMQSVYLWNKPPRNAETDADVVLHPATYRNGDGPDAVVANGRLYVCTYNGNHVLGWNTLPTRDNQPPDFAIGSDRTDQDTWAENFFIQNAVVATDGKSLFVSSDFDRKMFVWRNLPDESAAKPDLVFHLPEGPWDNELHGSTLALAGKNTVYTWRKLPLNGEPPDVTLSGSIGGVRLGELTGVAFDEKYFYLSDRRAESIYVWEGIPTRDSEPRFTLEMRSPGRLTSDGEYLCAAPFEGGGISLWRVSELGSRAEPITLGARGQFNLPSECLIADGRLFVANRSFNRVDVWDHVEDALAGRPAEALLGATDEQDRKPGIGRNKLFMPGSLAWGGGYLWVGEFKFSTRILRFSPQAAGARLPRSQQAKPAPAQSDSLPPASTAAQLNQMWSRDQARGEGAVKLQSFPLRLDDIGYIIPLGNMQSGHVTPSDHLYFVPKGAMNQFQGNQRNGQGRRMDDRDFSRLYDVVAVADGFVVMLQWRPNPPGGQAKYDPTVFDRAVDLKVFIEHSARVWSYVDHLIEVDAAIMKQVPGGVQPGQPVNVRIPVKAGQVIGKVGNQTFDFALIDTATTRKGFVKPERFLKRDSQKPHVVDPFDYIAEPLRGELIKKCARKVPPFGGRIDYDVDGRLIGNWYEEGTGGYAGLNRRIDYWIGHLSIVYHHLDPRIIVFSIGNYDGRAAQFWVKGNAPDPADIGEKDGIVKYELVYGQLGSTGHIQKRQDADEVQGTVLAQVLPNRKLKFEAIPGRLGAEVKGFTSAAKIYER